MYCTPTMDRKLSIVLENCIVLPMLTIIIKKIIVLCFRQVSDQSLVSVFFFNLWIVHGTRVLQKQFAKEHLATKVAAHIDGYPAVARVQSSHVPSR
jgi:hypothetical protein